jgi:hypothetical protein
MFVKVAVPEAAILVPARLPVAFTVNVVLIVAAEAAAHTTSAKAKTENIRFIGLLESSTLVTRQNGGTSLMQHHAGFPSGGLTLRVYIRHEP